ncbi:hydratase [Phreatobacter aquaticus]|uniref:Hydratase n=1 Tax=Phreatobacter aquaticus TaxID=2570229 RepID=A0A4D7Q922_9HYPH|nr:MaoC/PaaZ C-terminal domain-containing protein [Phreatobacter aquaticus]QCK84630.1 hydratase [Phreatobacter aquaticus]
MIATGPLFRQTMSLSQADFDLFARVSGDDNPIHVDPDFSARTRFGRTVSHGMLLYSRLWGLVGQHIPGGRQLTQSLMFPAPTFAGEPVICEASVDAITDGIASLTLTITRARDGETVCAAAATWQTGSAS